MVDCPHLGKWRGCAFQPRYDEESPQPEVIRELPSLGDSAVLDDTNIEALEMLRARIYVRDICTRCGKTVERV